MSEIFHDFRYSVQICHYLYNVTNKQTNTHTHSPITILAVTILFPLLMSETFQDFPVPVDTCLSSPCRHLSFLSLQTLVFPLPVDTCLYLPNETTNKQTAALSVVQTFHARFSRLSYQCRYHCHLRLTLPFPVTSKVTTSTALL